MLIRTHQPRVGLASLALLALGAACDPNVVIGARHGAGADVGGQAAGGSSAGLSGETATGSSGADVGVLFAADHENGSLSQWDEGADADAGGYYADAAPPEHSTEQARSGQASAKLTIDTNAGDSIARLYRRLEARDAYYSAWFYLAEDHTPGSWWSIFLFRAVQDRAESIDLWSLDLERRGDGTLTLVLFDHEASETIEVPGEPVVPVRQWFQVQAHLVQAEGEPSQLTFWLDGVEVLRLDETTTVPDAEPVYWVIGNGGATMSPAVSTIYVDDAQIARAFIAP
jgi:hypothetical protein